MTELDDNNAYEDDGFESENEVKPPTPKKPTPKAAPVIEAPKPVTSLDIVPVTSTALVPFEEAPAVSA